MHNVNLITASHYRLVISIVLCMLLLTPTSEWHSTPFPQQWQMVRSSSGR